MPGLGACRVGESLRRPLFFDVFKGFFKIWDTAASAMDAGRKAKAYKRLESDVLDRIFRKLGGEANAWDMAFSVMCQHDDKGVIIGVKADYLDPYTRALEFIHEHASAKPGRVRSWWARAAGR